jgi:hypothetical protein
MSDKLLLYEKLVATNPKVERKGATVPYTSLNGHMFSYLSKEGKLALRLPPAERDAFLKKYKAKLCTAYGVVQPEYVEVPDALLAKTAELKSSSMSAMTTWPHSSRKRLPRKPSRNRHSRSPTARSTSPPDWPRHPP